MSLKKKLQEKPQLHKRNKHVGTYDFDALTESLPGLSQFVAVNKYGTKTIDFFNPKAVKALNKALLINQYKIEYWDIPAGYLCPPIPGRADYIHHLSDLASAKNLKKIPVGKTIKVLDIGAGANCIYPIIGQAEYGWSFIASDIDEVAIKSAQQIVNLNPLLTNNINCRLQKNSNHFFHGVLGEKEKIDFSVCNPPFHASLKDAQEGNIRKTSNLRNEKTTKIDLNFGGKNNELWVTGGEKKFIIAMIKESKQFSKKCFWFSSLVSKKENLKTIYLALEKVTAVEIKTVKMGQGNKTSHLVAWTFLTAEEQLKWSNSRWNN